MYTLVTHFGQYLHVGMIQYGYNNCIWICKHKQIHIHVPIYIYIHLFIFCKYLYTYPFAYILCIYDTHIIYNHIYILYIHKDPYLNTNM